MSLDNQGRQLLAEALAEAMDRDLGEIPAQGQLEGQHHFSRSFERKMRRLDKQIRRGQKQTQPTGWGSVSRQRWGRYGAWAAAFVCVFGLAAVAAVGGFPRMGADQSTSMENSAADTGAGYAESEAADEAWDDGAAADDTAPEAAEPFEGETEDTGAFSWQEQLLAESAKADAWVDWSFQEMDDDGMVYLETAVHENLTEQTGMKQLRIGEISEVYAKQAADDWTRVYYCSDPTLGQYEAGAQWQDGYVLADLNITTPGTYRLVRQVNQYRQVLQLTVR